jgi:hypothetical protein
MSTSAERVEFVLSDSKALKISKHKISRIYYSMCCVQLKYVVPQILPNNSSKSRPIFNILSLSEPEIKQNNFAHVQLNGRMVP